MAQLSDFQIALAKRIAACPDGGEVLGWQRLGEGAGGTHWRALGRQGSWFVKTATDAAELFAAEADGLSALAAANTIRVPRVLTAGVQDDIGYIVMEWLELRGKDTGLHAAAQLGKALAWQHGKLADQFGWSRHNFIGATPQFNSFADDWVKFLRQHRLGFQLQLAAENGYRGELQNLGGRLLERLPEFFTDYLPRPSLLHGDLWGGNWGVLESGEPVTFDPAVYYGDREADLAMTELFGGFPAEFHAAYQDEFPLDSGYRVRRDVYNLYHLLNHLNLFGGSYLAQVERVFQRVFAETG
ncbi:MAG: fructosamine kinase family protein [Gammaproteobacteria bacterium]